MAPAVVGLALVLAAAPAVAAPQEATASLTGAPVGRLEVAAGGTIHFHAATGDHNVVANDGSWTTGLVREGQSVPLAFRSPGEFPFACTIHPNETGVVVAGKSEPPPPPPPPTPPPPKNAPPDVSILAPTGGAVLLPGEHAIRVHLADPDGGPGPHAAEVRVDGGAWQAMSPVGDGVWEWRWGATAGTHDIAARGRDAIDFGKTAAVRVVVEGSASPPPDGGKPPDPPPPGDLVVSISAPTEGARLLPSRVPIVGTATAKSGEPFRVLVRVDDGPWLEAEGSTRWTLIWDATAVEPGTRRIAVRAHDGNAWSDVAQVSVTLLTRDGFGTPRDPPSPPGGDWRETALSFGWIAVAGAALLGAWAWASSRP